MSYMSTIVLLVALVALGAFIRRTKIDITPDLEGFEVGGEVDVVSAVVFVVSLTVYFYLP
jgi:hypothetical protein